MSAPDVFVVESGAARLAVERAGQGDTVLFLHAGVADRRVWRPQVAALAPHAQAVAYDRRGFGDTTAPEEPHDPLADLEAVLDHVGARQAVLVGNSMGGRLALEFALERPERVAGLVLIGSAVSGAPAPEAFAPEIEAVLEDLEAAEESGDLDRVGAVEARLWLDGPTSPEGRVGGEARALFLDMNGRALRAAPVGPEHPQRPPVWDRLAEVRAPTLVVWGDLDVPHVPARGEVLARTIPGARRHVVTGTAHLPQLERPDEVTALLSRFLALVGVSR